MDPKTLVSSVVLLSILMVGCTQQSQPEPWSIGNNLNTRYGIYSMEIDGSGVTQIYGSDSLFITNALASPDGTKIVFYQQDGRDMESIITTEIVVINPDGTGYRKLTENSWMDFQPIWSPDNDEILFISDMGQGAGTDIYVMDTDGNVLRQLTDTPGVSEADPDWKCGKVVFTRNGTIWMMDEDGMNQEQLTDPAGRGRDVGVQFKVGDYDPNLSPDCTKVAFERLTGPGYNVSGTLLGDYDLYIYHISDGAYQDISMGQTADLIPEWSPDGTRIIFNHLSNVVDDLYDIFVINADGTGREKVTGDDPVSFVEEGCTWFGDRILFAAEKFD